MQDRYAGDIGDFGKFGLLRELKRQGFSIGINWYKTEPGDSEKHEDGKYPIPESLHRCDPWLAERLTFVFLLRHGLWGGYMGR